MRERPVAVTIFGILNIGYGLLGLGWVLLSKMLEGFDAMPAGASMGPYFSSMAALWEAMSKDPAFVVWNRISVPLDVAAGVGLTAAGIGLLLLKNWSRLLSNGWAVYTVISVFLNLAVVLVALPGAGRRAAIGQRWEHRASAGGGGDWSVANAGLSRSSTLLYGPAQGGAGI